MSDVNLATEQLLELLLTLKKTTPAAARGILNNQPAIAYALITLMVSMNAINIEVFQRTLAEFGAANASSLPTSTATPQIMSSVDSIMASTPLSAIPSHLQAQYRTTTPPSQTSPYGSYSQSNGQDLSHSYTSTPPNMNNTHEYGGYAGQYQQQPPSTYPGYPPTYNGQAATPAPSSKLTDALANIPDDQKALIMRVLSMTPEQINSLPPTERTTYIQIRATLGIPT
jgi:cleavage stimulation factor subunit 2